MADGPDPYPEHTKLTGISDQSQVIGEFVDWLADEHGILLAQYDRGGHTLMRTHRTIQDLLAEFFDIDQVKLEAEKRAMIDAMRAMNETVRA